MVALNQIKKDDLRELSRCLHSYHAQYISLAMISKANAEMHGIQTEHTAEFDIKANIIQAIELVLVNKMELINVLTLQFEESFPSKDVIADDMLFHNVSL